MDERTIEQQLVGHNQQFIIRATTPRAPQSFAEGLVKGMAIGAFITMILLDRQVIEFNPQTAGKVLTFYSGFALCVAAIGLKNQIQPNAPRLGFFERSLSPVPPQTRMEGIVKGFGAGFLVSILLMLSKTLNLHPNFSTLLMVCIGLATAGAEWGYRNEQRQPRP